MRIECAHCQQQFELEAGAERRCPKCMRSKGLRTLPAKASTEGAGTRAAGTEALGRGRLIAGLVGAAAVIAIVAFALLRQGGPGGGADDGGQQVAAELKKRGIEAGELARLLAADDAVLSFAREAAGSADSDAAKAEALVKAIRARASAGAFVPWSMVEPRAGALRLGGELLSSLGKDGARERHYPLELAALTVAALRALSTEQPVYLAEVYAYPDEKAPLDASGRFGYFAVALGGTPEGAKNEKGQQAQAKAVKPRLFDPYGGRSAQPAPGELRLLTDLEAVGAALSLKANQVLGQNGEPAAALRDADAAIALYPTSASVRTTRGMVLLSSGGEQEGRGELEAAAQMRPDGPRRHNAAVLALATGGQSEASKQLALALEQYPEYAAALTTLATLQMASGEREQAQSTLERVEGLDRELPSLPLAWAQWYMSGGDLQQALARAERAVELSPDNPQPRLMLARMQRQAGDYDGMRAHARKVMELVAESQKSRTKLLIEQLLGPTALEAPDAFDAEDDGTPDGGIGELADPGQLDLSSGSKLMGGEGNSGPSLLGGDGPGSLKLGGGAPKLRLGGSGSGLGPAPAN
ncbi:MAG: tetratricopeptide repeat protein [Myxococcales bacterium]|nr:tetratricopeptide repeat protein [Myxococcales bacterium]